MDRHKTENHNFEESSNNGHFIHCKNCGCMIAFLSSGIKAYDIFYICKCNLRCETAPVGKNVELLKRSRLNSHAYLYKTDNEHICPCCGKLLFKTYRSNINNFAFDVVCECGKRYNRVGHADELEKLHRIRRIDKPQDAITQDTTTQDITTQDIIIDEIKN